MGPKAEIYTFNQAKELLQMHENMLLNVFNIALLIDWTKKWIF